MPKGTISKSMNVGGIGMSGSAVRTENGQIGHEVSLPRGSAGDMFSFADGDGCVVTLEAGHICTDGNVDVYWYEDGVLKVKYGATVSIVVQVATLTLGTGGGDAYPNDVGLDMVISDQVSINTDFIGNEVEMLALFCDKVGHVEFLDDGPTNLAHIKLLAIEGWDWVKDGEVTNPLAGDVVDTLAVSNADPVYAATLKVGVLYDSA